MRWLATIALVSALGMTACGGSSTPRPRSPDPLASASGKMLLERGRAFHEAGDTIRAEQYLVAAIHRGAPARKVMPILLATCIRGQRFRAALAHAERYLAHRPDDRKLRQLTASLYLATSQPEKAREALEALVEDDPDRAEPRYLLAMAHQQLGDSDKAADQLRAFVELEPDGAMAREARAWLKASEGGERTAERRPRRHRRRHR